MIEQTAKAARVAKAISNPIKTLGTYILLIVSLLATGCAPGMYTTSARMDSGEQYSPTETVVILDREPNQPYEVMALLETRIPNAGLPKLIEDMRAEAAQLGADALILMGTEDQQQSQGVIYNPYLKGYQTIGGGTLGILRGHAIKYKP